MDSNMIVMVFPVRQELDMSVSGITLPICYMPRDTNLYLSNCNGIVGDISVGQLRMQCSCSVSAPENHYIALN